MSSVEVGDALVEDIRYRYVLVKCNKCGIEEEGLVDETSFQHWGKGDVWYFYCDVCKGNKPYTILRVLNKFWGKSQPFVFR